MKRTSIILMGFCALAMINCEKSEPTCFLQPPTFSVNGQEAADETITVNVLNNASLFLSVQESEGYTFHWSGPNGFESDLAMPEITDATESMSGLYTVTMTKGICNGEASVNVDVNNISPPCTTPINRLEFSGDIDLPPVNFYTIYGNANSGEYEVTANGSNGDLTITFATESLPPTGVYEISNECPTSFLTAGQVCMSLVYSNYWSVADSGTLYFTKLDNGNFTVSFCDVVFNSSYPFPLVGSAQINEN